MPNEQDEKVINIPVDHSRPVASQPGLKEEKEPGDLARDAILDEVRRLRREVQKLNSYRIFELYDSTPRLMWLQFLRGASFGLGSFLGATLVVSLVVSSLAYLASQVDFIPVLGDLINEVLKEINIPKK